MEGPRVLGFRDRRGRIRGVVWILVGESDLYQVVGLFSEWRDTTRTGRVCELQHKISTQGIRANVTADRARARTWSRQLRSGGSFRVCTSTCAI